MASDESGASPPTSAPGTASSRRVKVLTLIAVCVLFVAAISVYVYLNGRPRALTYSGTVETREIQVGSKVGGRVTAVFIEEGQRVAANAPLISFECDALKPNSPKPKPPQSRPQPT
jgi:multidrug efflux pump subunit AcrA (membrane-fusion protein)